MDAIIRGGLWLGFFAAVLVSWGVIYGMSLDMGLDLLGRPDAMAAAMRRMDFGMPMARFGPLFLMWAVMMAAMMLPTLMPTLRACCWGFMVLGFVGGVMNFAWMGLATLFMVIEKLPQVGHHVTRPMGALLILAGLAVIVSAG